VKSLQGWKNRFPPKKLLFLVSGFRSALAAVVVGALLLRGLVGGGLLNRLSRFFKFPAVAGAARNVGRYLCEMKGLLTRVTRGRCYDF
jgi:hypothetical protein